MLRAIILVVALVILTRVGSALLSAQSYAGDITAFADGGNPVRFLFLSLFRANPAAQAAIPVVGALVYYSWRRNRKEIEE